MTGRIQTDTIGYRRDVVIGLTVRSGGSDYPLAAFLEIQQGVAYCFRVRRSGRQLAAVQPYTEDSVVALSKTDIAQYLIQPHRFRLGIRTVRHRPHQVGKRIRFFSLLYQGSFELQTIDRMVLQRHGGRGEHIPHNPTENGTANEIHCEEDKAAAQAAYSAAGTGLTVLRILCSVNE